MEGLIKKKKKKNNDEDQLSVAHSLEIMCIHFAMILCELCQGECNLILQNTYIDAKII